MSKEDVIEVEGKVVEVLPGTKFKVQLPNGHVITTYLSGNMRKDTVKVEMSPYDLNSGRISYRNKN